MTFGVSSVSCFLLLIISTAKAFVPPLVSRQVECRLPSPLAASSSTEDQQQQANAEEEKDFASFTTTTTRTTTTTKGLPLLLGRRSLLQQTATTAVSLTTAASLLSSSAPPAIAKDADAATTVVLAGATGRTGRQILGHLVDIGTEKKGLRVVATVRNVDKAKASLKDFSSAVGNAIARGVESSDGPGVDLRPLDVEKDSVDEMADTLRGAQSMVIALAFTPEGNPFRMNELAHAVDNVGTIKLIDAAKKAGIQKVVLLSSILTNGRNWGQEKSPGFVITNAFGNALDEKIVAENYLRKSGLDYTIVRAAGLKAKPPVGTLVISGEDTLNGGEISRELVADVCIASLTDAKASNKVLEIYEDEGVPYKVFNGLNM